MKKIVLVEDEAPLQKALSIELLNSGFTVLAASDGKAGLELIQKEHPDAVLLDLMLPKMNGFDVLKELKNSEATKNIPVIILSNLGQDEDRAEGMKRGATDYFVKSSTDLSKVTEKLRELLK